LAAEELAWGLKSFPVPGVGKIQEISSTEFPEVLREKKGIIFFKDYWQRTVNGKKQNFRNILFSYDSFVEESRVVR